MKKKVWDITVKDNPNRVVMGENDEFYTTDTEAYLVFNLDDENFNPATAVLTLENRNDGSLKNETVDVVDGLIEWEMPQRYIEHFGNWQGQLVYEDAKDGQPELYTSAPFSFVVNAHIGDKKQPSLVEIENWEKFIRDGTELIETWEDLEVLREENERQRQANYQELLDTGVLQTNINTKLEALEEEYAPKLTEVTAQLAQKVGLGKRAELEDLSPTVLSAIEGGEGTSFDLLSIPQNESVGLSKLDNHVKELIGVKPVGISWTIGSLSGSDGSIIETNITGLTSVNLIDISNEGLDIHIKGGQGLRFWMAYFDADTEIYNHTYSEYITSSTKIEPIPNTKARIVFSFSDDRELSSNREVLDFISVYRNEMDKKEQRLIDYVKELIGVKPVDISWAIGRIMGADGSINEENETALTSVDLIDISNEGLDIYVEEGQGLRFWLVYFDADTEIYNNTYTEYITSSTQIEPIPNTKARIEFSFPDFRELSSNREVLDFISVYRPENGGVAEPAEPGKNIPTYWHSHLNSKIERITQLQNECGIDGTSFGFITDTHASNHVRSNELISGMLVEEIIKKCDIPYFIHGGDFVSGGGNATKQSIINDIRVNKEMFGEHFSRILMVEGNHDSAYSANFNETPIYSYAKNLTPEECYNYYFRHNAVPPQRVVGGNGSYFYQDDNVNKIRYVLLNSSDLPHGEDEYGYSLKEYNKMRRALMREEQVKWFADVALNVPDSAWGVVVCSHIEPYSTNMPVGNGEITANILQAFKNKTVYSGSSPINVPEEFKFNISVDFTNKGGNVICWVSGHMHYDSINRNTPENIDFNIVETLNDGLDVYLDSPIKTPGTVTEQAFDVFTINKKTRTVDVTRVGAGQNRQFSY